MEHESSNAQPKTTLRIGRVGSELRYLEADNCSISLGRGFGVRLRVEGAAGQVVQIEFLPDGDGSVRMELFDESEDETSNAKT